MSNANIQCQCRKYCECGEQLGDEHVRNLEFMAHHGPAIYFFVIFPRTMTTYYICRNTNHALTMVYLPSWKYFRKENMLNSGCKKNKQLCNRVACLGLLLCSLRTRMSHLETHGRMTSTGTGTYHSPKKAAQWHTKPKAFDFLDIKLPMSFHFVRPTERAHYRLPPRDKCGFADFPNVIGHNGSNLMVKWVIPWGFWHTFSLITHIFTSERKYV